MLRGQKASLPVIGSRVGDASLEKSPCRTEVRRAEGRFAFPLRCVLPLEAP